MPNSIFIISVLLLLQFARPTFANQSEDGIENIAVSHPVYDFLFRAESKGILEYFSLSDIPLQRKEILKALKIISKSNDLSENETEIINNFLKEFDIYSQKQSVFIGQNLGQNSIYSWNIFSSDEKYIYAYQDSNKNVRIEPLANIGYQYLKSEKTKNMTLANAGIRAAGSISSHLGYSLSVTNGRIIAGDSSLALRDKKLSQNIKFAILNSDFDFTESNVQFDYDWFFASIGRETRLVGAGLESNLFFSDNAPPQNTFSLGARFKSFRYKFTHSGLLSSVPDSVNQSGYNLFLNEKYSTSHRFTLLQSWGEVSFWENIIYSDRPFDISYLNPFSFLKSVEHANRDRDNSLMGFDFSVRPINNFQIKGGFLLDDIVFEKIGDEFWSNKWAWNIAMLTSLPFDTDVGIEYTRVEPYTFSHFNEKNSVTNDGRYFMGQLEPNSEKYLLSIKYWWTNRFPLKINFSHIRHGENILNKDKSVNYNAGSDVGKSIDWERDSEQIKFLSGNLIEYSEIGLSTGYEIIRDFSVHFNYTFRKSNNNKNEHFARFTLQIGYF
jgi:hypothetical protein